MREKRKQKSYNVSCYSILCFPNRENLWIINMFWGIIKELEIISLWNHKRSRNKQNVLNRFYRNRAEKSLSLIILSVTNFFRGGSMTGTHDPRTTYLTSLHVLRYMLVIHIITFKFILSITCLRAASACLSLLNIYPLNFYVSHDLFYHTFTLF